MATKSATKINFLLLLLLFCRLKELKSQSSPVDDASSYLQHIFKEATNFEELNKNYYRMMSQYNVTKLNISELVERTSDSLSRKIDITVEALQNTTEYAEKLYRSHSDSGCCSEQCNRKSCDPSICNVSYYRAAFNEVENNPPFTFDPYFHNAVNVNTSSVHIPVSVYDKDPDVLCFIEWSQNLTDQFYEVWNMLTNDYHIRVTSQYIGSTTGGFRTFPSYKFIPFGSPENCPFERVDTFDVRHRPWYVETIPGHKAFVILIDSSGSMVGTKFQLARLFAREVINNLPIDDFFMVLRVGGIDDGESYHHYGNCFDNFFVQAMEENKVIVQAFIADDNRPNGTANFNRAIEYAVMKLENITACHKGILIISDGDAVFPEERIGTDIRVYSFQVSVINERSKEMRTLACNNGGFLCLVNNFDKVLSCVEGLTDHYHTNSNETIISNHRYIDILTKRTITTFSLPVKLLKTSNDETEEDSTSNGGHSFVGVMGIDVLSFGSDLLTLGRLLGPFGYAFLVDNNGYTLYHPLLEEASSVRGDLDNRDITQFEFGVNKSDKDTIEELRKDMINRVTGEMNVSAYVSMEYQRRYIVKDMSYYYSPMQNSHITLSLGIKVPSEGLVNTSYSLSPLSTDQLNELSEFVNSEEAQSETILLIGNKPYCHDIYNYSYNDTSSVLQLLDRLIDLELCQMSLSASFSTECVECVQSLYIPLLVDLYFAYENKNLLNNGTATGKVLSTFVEFSSGLLWCWPASSDFDCFNISTVNYIGLAQNNGDILSVYRRIDNPVNTNVVIVRQLSLPPEEGGASSILGGVAGIVISELPLSHNESYYLLDDGGYIVAAPFNLNETLSIRHLPPCLYEVLVSNGFYVSDNVTGFNVRPCSPPVALSHRSSATTLTMSCSSTRPTGSPPLDCPAIALCQSCVSFHLSNYKTREDAGGDGSSTSTKTGTDGSVYTNTTGQIVMTCADSFEMRPILYQISPVNGTNMLAILLDDTTCVAEESGGGKGGRDEIQLSEVALPCPCSYQRFRPSDPSICIHEFQLTNSQCGNSAPSTMKTMTFTLLILQPIITILILLLQ